MIAQFFSTAMMAPGRQSSFRRTTFFHLIILCCFAWVLDHSQSSETLITVGHALIAMGIVEGGVLVGWRLTQLPKSQALEFLLTSPLHPYRVFLAEALVGIGRLGLVCLSGLPLFLAMLFSGKIEGFDLIPMILMPFTWGAITGIGLAVWAYESRSVRRIGEFVALFGVLVYLVVGVLAGERLKNWLQALPPDTGQFFFDIFQGFHNYNPFGCMQYWMNSQRIPEIALERMIYLQLFALVFLGLLFWRGMSRLKGHFADRHYRPISSDRAELTQFIGEKPLSWWAVRRVMDYSGRVNLWLAGGFSLIYSAYIVAADQWPPWMGQLVFQIFEKMGGAPILITAMIVLAAVPAAFQYGLWDASSQDRCRRLELLLLTELNAKDYWHAAISAAWRRGRGYFVIAFILWAAMLYAGKLTIPQFLGSLSAAVILWNFSFVVGFRAFSNGMQANGLGSLLTLGFPLIAFGFMQIHQPIFASLFPPGALYITITRPPNPQWLVGPMVIGLFTLWFTQRCLAQCDNHLRAWYDLNHGKKSLD